MAKQLNELLSVFSDLTNLLEVNIKGLALVDGAGSAQRDALQRLSDYFNDELQKFQNPVDCTKRKHLLMNINKACGFGCQLHHAAHCFRLAIGSGRVLHLTNSTYSYSTNGFLSIFLPLTSCQIPKFVSNEHSPVWDSPGYEDATYVFCPIVEDLRHIPTYAPPAVPSSIADALSHLHGAPPVWVSGHLLAYIMRLRTSKVSESINQLVQRIRGAPTSSPIVGVHIRRTDKTTLEAAFHALGEYMRYVDEYFDKLDAERLMRARTTEWAGDNTPSLALPVPRRIFIATDDADVFSEVKRRYSSLLSNDGKPRYEFVGDVQRAQSASLRTRFTHDSLIGIVTDVIALSYTDYIVCTFSSQICRLAYELMQTHSTQLGDASMCAQSLDDTYYYGGQQTWYQTMITDDNETNMKAGDMVAYLGNHWNGSSKISLPASGKEFIRPAYKIENRLLSVDFPGFKLNFSLT